MQIGIIGFGRFGQLLARLLSPTHSVAVFDINSKAKETKTNKVAFLALPQVASRELVILAVPISQISSVVKQIKPYLKPISIVMDTCSVKEYPLKQMRTLLPTNIQILGTHPMFGPDSAKAGLKGLQMVFCPVRIKRANYLAIKRLFAAMGLKTIEMTPAAHDRQNALVLAMVHFLGRGLEQMKIKPQTITTLGFERLLKVCETVTNDSWQLFCDMQYYNRYAQPARDNLLKALNNVEAKLQDYCIDKSGKSAKKKI